MKAPPPEVIRVPVAIPCVSADEIPSIPSTVMRTDTHLVPLVELYRADLDAFKLYAIKVDVLLRACAKAQEVKK